MITIIHGDDIVLSRKYLQEQKQDSLNPYVFDGTVDLQSIIQASQGTNLFSTEKKIFIENFFSKNKTNTSETKSIINYINKNTASLELFLWEPNVLQKRLMSLFINPSIKTFKIPQSIFLFLDSLKPDSYKNTINLFHKALQSTPEEIILFMLQRQFRLLIAISDEKSKDSIDEVLRLAPWQKSKLEKQAKLFSSDNLLTIYKKLYQIDLAQKTGSLPYSLICSIDFLLLDI